ncbi:hypothetical protein D3C72_1489930 [compost metagenome]
MLEAQFLVQPDAAFVRGVDPADQHMHLPGAGALDQRAHQDQPQPQAAKARIHVYGMLHRILEGRPGAERAVAGESHQLAGLVLDAHHRKAALLLGLKPRNHGLGRPRLVVVQRGGRGDGFIENGQDLVGMTLMRAIDQRGALRGAKISVRVHAQILASHLAARNRSSQKKTGESAGSVRCCRFWPLSGGAALHRSVGVVHHGAQARALAPG